MLRFITRTGKIVLKYVRWWEMFTAGVAYEANKPLSFEDIHCAPPQPTEVRVKITNACVCQSDLYFWKGKVTINTGGYSLAELAAECL